MTLCTGDTATATIAIYNSGVSGWYRDSWPALLGTWSPSPGQDQPSTLGGDGTNGSPNTGWPRYNRVAIQPAPYVGPNQVAWFQFQVRAPSTPGTYRLYVRPLVEGAPLGGVSGQWMDDQGIFWQITVKLPGEEVVIVDTVNIDGDSFTAGSSTFRYDANDTFQYLGAAITFGVTRYRATSEGIIVELCGGNAGRNASGGGRILAEPRDEGERLIDKPQAIEHHRFDGFTHGEVPHFRVLLGRAIEDVANAEFVEHASDKAEVVQDLATVWRLVGHNNLLCWCGDCKGPPRKHKNNSNGRERCGKADRCRRSRASTAIYRRGASGWYVVRSVAPKRNVCMIW